MSDLVSTNPGGLSESQQVVVDGVSTGLTKAALPCRVSTGPNETQGWKMKGSQSGTGKGGSRMTINMKTPRVRLSIAENARAHSDSLLSTSRASQLP